MKKLKILRIFGFIIDTAFFFFISYLFLSYVAIGSAEDEALTKLVIRFIIALLATVALYDLSFHVKYMINTEEWKMKRYERKKKET